MRLIAAFLAFRDTFAEVSSCRPAEIEAALEIVAVVLIVGWFVYG